VDVIAAPVEGMRSTYKPVLGRVGRGAVEAVDTLGGATDNAKVP